VRSGKHLPKFSFNIAQEALSNAWRHAEATQDCLRLARRGDRVELAIADNGSGFDPTSVSRADSRFGLLGMSERAEALGGHLRIYSHTRGSLLLALLFHTSIAVTGLFLSSAKPPALVGLALNWGMAAIVIAVFGLG
jgi:signal transduction histidine kinase